MHRAEDYWEESAKSFRDFGINFQLAQAVKIGHEQREACGKGKEGRGVSFVSHGTHLKHFTHKGRGFFHSAVSGGSGAD